MTSRSARPPAHPAALALAGLGIAGTVAMAGIAPGLLATAAAKTIVVVGGASDPDGKDQWERIRGDYAGAAPVFVHYPAQFGVGFPGFALSADGENTFATSVDTGADATVQAIESIKDDDPDEEVVVYTISQGADVVGIAVLRYGAAHPAPNGAAKLTVIEQGSPSFVRSGMWNVIPPGIPGLMNGPVRNDGASGATVVSVCVKGDYACGLGGNPVSAVFYFIPGYDMHGKVYTAQNIGKYSPEDGEGFTPGAVAETPVATTVEMRNGNEVTVERYADGTVKRTWNEDNVTWVSLDKGENPWGWMLRAQGIPVPIEFDRVLNRLVPVNEPGDTGLPSFPPLSAGPAPSPLELTSVFGDSGDAAKHREGTPGTVPVQEILTRTMPTSDPVERDTNRVGSSSVPQQDVDADPEQPEAETQPGAGTDGTVAPEADGLPEPATTPSDVDAEPTPAPTDIETDPDTAPSDSDTAPETPEPDEDSGVAAAA
ncbi:PE-PPE domain-containing protein [Tsukamurella sp. PLM1]|uniref:PE-PPE domain-containing protein n=1 Tax=Tsukamurella sp. PLM1 TaxID=2929795 RepID=UPI0020469318|nr:PE-PPE domain-containing protein [Tsukamurella sp. PLM1]BDH57569.1 hypothetical protein MTP03_25080 [Tsukamurella sp. PLM1]